MILGFYSTSYAAPPQWWLTCHIEEHNKLANEVKKYSIQQNQSTSDAITIQKEAQTLLYFGFTATRLPVAKQDPLTPWLNVGDQSIIINVSYNGFPISKIVGKTDALSVTTIGGKTLILSCFAFFK